MSSRRNELVTALVIAVFVILFLKITSGDQKTTIVESIEQKTIILESGVKIERVIFIDRAPNGLLSGEQSPQPIPTTEGISSTTGLPVSAGTTNELTSSPRIIDDSEFTNFRRPTTSTT
jgi:hypothetical protein